MLVIDTSSLPEEDRLEAWAAAMSSTEVPQLTDFVASPEPPHHRLDAWPLLPGVHLLMNAGTPIRIARRQHDLSQASPERVVLSMVGFPARIESFAGQRELVPGDLLLVDQTSAHDFRGLAAGRTPALIMDYAVAGITVDDVRTAMRTLTSNPLYGALRSHMSELVSVVLASDDPRARNVMVEGALQLFHSLVQLAAEEASETDAYTGSALVPGAKLFIRAHLTHRDLSPRLIADAHHVSVRTLYYAWSRTEIPLAEWIMRERLEAAKGELAGRDSITAIAMKYGFSSSAHFARRFRAVYGTTPSEWRRLIETPAFG